MKKFYIFINEEQIGPFSIDELKHHIISKDTKVWYEGLGDWKNAFEIEELKSILISIPPPVSSFTSKPPTPKFVKVTETQINDNENIDSKILGLKKYIIYRIVGGIIIILGLVYFINMQTENSIKLMEQNKQSEIYYHQLDKQQKEIEKQRIRISEQEQIEAKRKIQEQKNKLEAQYAELNQELNVQFNNLSTAKENLNNVSAFKLLRTARERNEQINATQNEVDLINQQIKDIESEMEKINKKLII